MTHRRPFVLRVAIAALLNAAVLLPGSVHAEMRTCTRAITVAAAKFVRLQYKALRRCNDGVLKGTRPGPCPDVQTATRLAKLDVKLRAAIDKKCGGADHSCGSGVDDDSLASIGWNIGACPNFENGSCTNTIADCGDIADCLQCVGHAAVAQAIALSYDDLDGMQSDPHVVGCQRVIGKNAERFFSTKMNALRKCNERVILAYSNGPCPDAIAIAAIAKAEAKKVKGICKFCGGADKLCGTADDLTPATIGFSANCPDVTVPGGAACAAPISDMQAIVDCVDCVNEFKADCVDALAAPTVETYPPECNGGTSTTATPVPPTPTLTATATATPTPTPTVTLPLPTITLPLPTITLPLPTITLPLPTVTLPLATPTIPIATPTLSLALPTVTLPLPTVTLPLATVTLPLPTVTLPLATVTLPLPTVTLPLPTVTLPLPTVTLPLPTVTLPLPTVTSTPVPATATITSTPFVPTPTPTSTPVCGNGTLDPGEVCELPALGCVGLQVCVLCQQCIL